MKVKYLNPQFLAEEKVRTGSNQFDEKNNRLYVGIFDENTNWFVPLEGKLSLKAPKDGVFETPFKNNNPHLKRPGLNLQKSIFISEEMALLDIRNTMPLQQYQFIEENLSVLEEQFVGYIKRILQLPITHPNVVMSTVPFYPEGIDRLLGQRVDIFGLEGEVVPYKFEERETNNTIENVKKSDNKINDTQQEQNIGEQELINVVTNFVASDGFEELKLFENNELVVDAETDSEGYLSVRRWQEDIETNDSPIYVWNGNERTMPKTAIVDIVETIRTQYPEAISYYNNLAQQKIIQATIKNKDYQGLAKHLKAGITQYLNSGTFKRYLDFVSKFHNYSSKNNTLILAQNNQASYVASFKKWQELGRKVSRGSKAIYVYAPMKVTKKDEQGNPLKGEDGKSITLTKYHLTPVFDVTQTTGKELPKAIYELTDNLSDPQQFTKLFQELSDLTSSEIIFDRSNELTDDANGCYLPAKDTILIKHGMGQQQTIKTLVHEVIHARLHQKSQATFGSDAYAKQEFEAESVAYIVTSHLGIDSSEYTFGYLNSWTDGGEKIAGFEESLATITKEAQQLISDIDTKLEKVHQLQSPTNKFDERVANVKADIIQESEQKSWEQPDPKVKHL